MRPLLWLKNSDYRFVLDEIERVAVKELKARHWGDHLDGASSGGAPRVFVHDPRGIALVAGVMRYNLTKLGTKILYRGQPKDWHLTPSLYRGITTIKERKNKDKLLISALEILSKKFDPRGSEDEREALSQHYGLRTRWIDVVDHMQTAAWFACHNGVEEGFDGSVGYLYLLAIPESPVNDFCRVIDLRCKPSQWLRPHIQQAYVLRAQDTQANSGKLHQFHLLTIAVPQYVLKRWSSIEFITRDHFFPNQEQDHGARFWERAKADLLKDPMYQPLV